MSEQVTSSGERNSRLGRLRGRSAAPPGGSPGTGTTTDPLTGLPTRTHLQEAIAAATAASRATSSHCVLSFVDLDSLRDVNDTFGPDAGDAVLIEVAGRLAGIDLFDTRIMRYGGAEFALVSRGVNRTDGPGELAQAILERVGAPFTIGPDQVTVACHVGQAIGGDAAGDSGELVRDAHHALVEARDLGPGSYVTHDESRRGRYSTRIDEARLHSALDNHEFLLHYQPIVRTDSGELIGVEALLRWQAPGATNLGILFPHDFLALLEKSGLIVPVGRWVIEETCRQAAVWSNAHPELPPLFVTCNLGARQLAMPDFADTVLEVVAASGMPARQLCLDITEQALRYNGATTWSALRRLKEAGIKLGIDDFGTGAASLAALRDLKLDLIRIDRLFVADLAMSAEDQAIVRHVTNMAHELEMVTVAEGIESEEQAAVLTTLGVDLAQGFLYGRPETPDRISERLEPPEQEAPWDALEVASDPPDGVGNALPPAPGS
jgi:diguanylate cyclase (GGDEF)-like protein